jgi:hypothetical protein
MNATPYYWAEQTWRAAAFEYLAAIFQSAPHEVIRARADQLYWARVELNVEARVLGAL